jgi:hypothetical protein
MPSANQNKSLLNTSINLTLLAGIAASFAWTCSSSSSNNGAGGSTSTADTGGSTSTADTGGSTSTGGSMSTANTGGSPSTGGSTSAPAQGGSSNNGTGGAASFTPCTVDAATGNVTTGPVCTFSPPLFALSATCGFGTWDPFSGIISGGFGIWGGINADCAATAGAMHVSGSYMGADYVDAGTKGSGIAGMNTYFNVPGDAGGGCSILNASSYSGFTFDADVTAAPGNLIIVGFNSADGNSAELNQVLPMGKSTQKFDFGVFSKKTFCGPPTGSNITTLYLVFPWYSGTDKHDVDVTFSNIGFY